MNLVVIPFHDWRKIIKEGFRTRDAHFIENLSGRKEIKTIIINRPITLLEILLKKKKRDIDGEVILRKGGLTLYRVDKGVFLIDFVSNNIFKQIIQKYRWYINSYADSTYVAFIEECLIHLGVDNYSLLSQNVFSYKLISKLKPNICVFDAWDNFMKFKVYQSIVNEVEDGYATYAKYADFWVTNARENIPYFIERFKAKKIHLISNGVDLDRFVHNSEGVLPEDLSKIKRPIVGFGGKITQLLDIDLINEVVQFTPEVSFVFVGQILDRNVFSKIKKQPNLYYLGDKHYDSYPNYVKNFDICIVPYVTGEEQKSGANSIKVYEYLATGKKVVGTVGNGLEDLQEHLFLAHNASEFSDLLKDVANSKMRIDFNFHSWEHKVDSLIDLMQNETNS